MKKLLFLVAFSALLFIDGAAQAQCNGQFQPGQVCGNSGTSSSVPGPMYINGAGTTFNVKNYGATGNGTTDDTTAINAAIAAFNTATNGVLYFPAGTYKTTTALTAITANGIIKGDGQTVAAPQATTIQSNSTTAVLFTINSPNLLFSDLALQNTSSSAPTVGSAGILVTSGNLSQRVDYLNLDVMGFYIDIDIKVSNAWSMVNANLINPILYALRINNIINCDAGDWSITNSQFISYNTGLGVPTSAIRHECSGGGKITNIKINSGNTALFANGIDIVGTGVTSDMQISNSSIESWSGSAININGGLPGITIIGLELGVFGNTPTHFINVTSNSSVIISGLTLIGSTSGVPINLSSCTNCYVGTITAPNVSGGLSALFTGGSLPDNDGTGSIGGGSHFVTSPTGTEDRLIWTGRSGTFTEFKIQQNAGDATKGAYFQALNDTGVGARMFINGSSTGGASNSALFSGGAITGLASDDQVTTGGVDDVTIYAGGVSQGALLVQHNGHVDMPGQNQTAPTLTAGCNGAGSSITGDDARGTVTGQTAAATTCTLTFGHAYTATPFCVGQGNTSPLTGAFTPSTTTLVVNFASTANYQWTYHCFGK